MKRQIGGILKGRCVTCSIEWKKSPDAGWTECRQQWFSDQLPHLCICIREKGMRLSSTPQLHKTRRLPSPLMGEKLLSKVTEFLVLTNVGSLEYPTSKAPELSKLWRLCKRLQQIDEHLFQKEAQFLRWSLHTTPSELVWDASMA